MKLAMTAKSMTLMLLTGVTILALGVLACVDINSAMMHGHESLFSMPAHARRLSNITTDVVPRQLQDGMQTAGMGALGNVVNFFQGNIMILWLIVLILGCCGCHTVAHYLSIALTGISYLELCMGRRPMMGMGGYPMGGMGGYPMGGMGGYPMQGGMGGYPMGGGMGGGYPMGDMGGQPMHSGNGHHHHASGGGGYHGGFHAQPVHHASYGPAGRQPDGSWKF